MSEDRSAPASPEDRDSGLFLLKKDSERRAILFKVLNDDQAKVISNLRENHIQVCLYILHIQIVQARKRGEPATQLWAVSIVHVVSKG